MPSRRLLLMGLLSKYPNRSSVLQKFATNTVGSKYSDFEKMHITATQFTPGMTKAWLGFQFEQLGMDEQKALRKMRMIAYAPKNRARWEHLGQENVLHIGPVEVERYFLRRNPHRGVYIPNWALPVFNDDLKRGMSKTAVAEKYGLYRATLYSALRRSMFDPPVTRIANLRKK
jgi:hypothetical protein